MKPILMLSRGKLVALAFGQPSGTSLRFLSSTVSLRQKDKYEGKFEGTTTPQPTGKPESKSGGWLNKILGGQKVDVSGVSHSTMLADKEVTFELSTHEIKPGHVDEYMKQYAEYIKLFNSKNLPVELTGSWKVVIGKQLDQAVHVWKHKNGYATSDQVLDAMQSDRDLIKASAEQALLCTRRRTSIVLPFSFWGEPKPRDPKHIYELRSYTLKPGTMIEWGNNWARGIRLRRDEGQDAFGCFSQIGPLYRVYHFWAYKSLADRKRIREETWAKPGWDTNVAYTVPLLQKMESKIMVANPWSPMQ